MAQFIISFHKCIYLFLICSAVKLLEERDSDQALLNIVYTNHARVLRYVI